MNPSTADVIVVLVLVPVPSSGSTFKWPTKVGFEFKSPARVVVAVRRSVHRECHFSKCSPFVFPPISCWPSPTNNRLGKPLAKGMFGSGTAVVFVQIVPLLLPELLVLLTL